MKILISFLMTIFFCACDRKNDYRNLIVKEDSSYWDLYRKNVPYESYLFKKNGECFEFFYTKQDSFFRRDDEDVERPNTWEIFEDTLVKIRGYERRILYLNKDSMILLNSKVGDTSFFRRKNNNKMTKNSHH